MSLRIHALPVGVLHNFPTAALTYQRGWGQVQDVPQIMFVITGGPRPVVVDTGTPDAGFVREHHGYDFERPDDQHPRAVLDRIGVDPLDVELVINTHLHWDHCGNNALFANARFVVQKAELEYARNPLEPTRVAFENTDVIDPPWMPVEDRIDAVDGDADVAPGLSVVRLPGHTPGSQGVLVDTGAGGRFLIAGDCVNLYRNWEGDGTLRHIVGGSLMDLRAHLDSFTRIEGLGAEVIPSHDPLVLERGVFG
ncbi:N-acyl homoserine lactonase family protein [Spirillospora sp. NPDC048832]